MEAGQIDYLQHLNSLQDQLAQAWIGYWRQYTLGTWQFWLHVAMFFLPLVVLYFFIDRRRALQIGFFGFNVHVWFTYIDAFGIRHALWNYPYPTIPLLSVSFSLDAALIPVLYMLLYQWTLNHRRNYYLYTTILCILLAFAFKPLLVAFDLFQLYKGTTYVHLFLGYITIMLVSKWITNLFLHFQKEGEREREPYFKGNYNLGRIFQRKEKAK